MDLINLYHGSIQKVTMPLYGFGKVDNDYGQGFYCTKHIDLAKEWAVSENQDGYANKYQIDLDTVKVLDLNQLGTLSWLAVLISNRTVRMNYPIMKQSRDWLIENHLPDISGYDVIKGYRADDSYFTFTRDFLSNVITLEQLEMAMQLGDLGEQYVIKSKNAFLKLKYIDSEACDYKTFYPLKKKRDNDARSRYQQILEETDMNGIRIIDIIKNEKRV